MFTYYRKAQYHETDSMGVIHHSNYIKWMEEARVAFLDEAGVGYAEIEKKSFVSPVVSLSVDYKKPVFFSDEVEISLSVKSYNGIRLELEYSFFNRTRNELCTTAFSKHCFIKDGRIISLKKQFPELDVKFSEYIAE